MEEKDLLSNKKVGVSTLHLIFFCNEEKNGSENLKNYLDSVTKNILLKCHFLYDNIYRT